MIVLRVCSPLPERRGAPRGISSVTLAAPVNRWPATVFESKAMPDSCYFESNCVSEACLVAESVPAGPLTSRGTANIEKECDAGQCFDSGRFEVAASSPGARTLSNRSARAPTLPSIVAIGKAVTEHRAYYAAENILDTWNPLRLVDMAESPNPH